MLVVGTKDMSAMPNVQQVSKTYYLAEDVGWTGMMTATPERSAWCTKSLPISEACRWETRLH